MRGMFSFGKVLAEGKKNSIFSLLLKQPHQAFFVCPCSATILPMLASSKKFRMLRL